MFGGFPWITTCEKHCLHIHYLTENTLDKGFHPVLFLFVYTFPSCFNFLSLMDFRFGIWWDDLISKFNSLLHQHRLTLCSERRGESNYGKLLFSDSIISLTAGLQSYLLRCQSLSWLEPVSRSPLLASVFCDEISPCSRGTHTPGVKLIKWAVSVDGQTDRQTEVLNLWSLF